MEPPVREVENKNPVRLYREEMVLAIAAGLSNTEDANTLSTTTLFSNFDTLPIARSIASFLPLPAIFVQKQVCNFVHHRLAASVGVDNNTTRTNTIIKQSTRYAQELLQVGLFLGTLEHCVQLQGNNFWQRYAPRKVWEATILSGSNRRCETVWEFTPVIHSGTQLKITVPSTAILINVVVEEELKAGHFIWLREWLNGQFNNNNSQEEAVQAILEVVHYSAEEVHLQAVAYASNGDFGFLNHPSYTVKYRSGWRCLDIEYDNDDDDDETNSNSDDDWLREIWDMYVKPLSPWKTHRHDNNNEHAETTNEYSQFWKQHLDQHVTFAGTM